MSRLSLFNSPLLLGFEQFEQALDRVSKNADGYPPYDVEQIGENRLCITLAIAGFAPEELSVQLEKNQLTVKGRRKEDRERVYLHRGIAARQFHRSFVLADGLEVTGATIENGLLRIDIERPFEEPDVKTIAIKSVDTAGAAQVIDQVEEKEDKR